MVFGEAMNDRRRKLYYTIWHMLALLSNFVEQGVLSFLFSYVITSQSLFVSVLGSE